MRRAVWFSEAFREANAFAGRYRVLMGSAGSGKSVNVAQDYLLKLSDPRYAGANLLVLRKVEESCRDSAYAELCGAARRMFGREAAQLWHSTRAPLGMENTRTGARIVFRGMKDAAQREKVKSISFERGKLCWIWCEEATEFLPEDFEILDDRLRGDLAAVNPRLFYQITLSFNPVSAGHWLKARFFDAPPDDDVFCHHSTYLGNPFIDEAYHRRMLRRARFDPAGYRVYGLGEWGEEEGQILTQWRVHEFDTDPEGFDHFAYGQDFGYNHANAILGVGAKDGELFVCSELYQRRRTTEALIAAAEAAGVERRREMFCDSAEPDRIQAWRAAGYRALPVKKEPGSVAAQIDYLKRRPLHIHPACVNTRREIAAWRWKKDTLSGHWLDEPAVGEDDAMAALRYSVERLRRGPRVAVLK